MLDKLFTNHDYLNIHKILGFGCLLNYSLKLFYNVDNYTPIFHLLLSTSSFIFKVPILRLNSKTIIWKELQLHNIIFTSRSIFTFYHASFFPLTNPYLYYSSRLSIIIFHHYLADIISNKYQNNDKTTTRNIPYDTNNKVLIKINKNFYAISQIIATTTLLTTTNKHHAFFIMFPIQLSTFLMTLVRKDIISNNSWHLLYSASLILPYIINLKIITNNNNNKIVITLLNIILRLVFNTNKYLNLIGVTSYYLIMNY